MWPKKLIRVWPVLGTTKIQKIGVIGSGVGGQAVGERSEHATIIKTRTGVARMEHYQNSSKNGRIVRG